MDTIVRSRVAGGSLIASSLLEIVAMAHHPTVNTPSIAEAVQRIAESRALAGLVHGILIALMLMIVYGLSEFALQRGAARPAIRLGLIAYGCGVLLMVGAALVSGFIVPGSMAWAPHSSEMDLAINAQLLILCRALNQSCANAGAVAMSVGIACWSVDLARREAAWRRALGIAGLLVGVLPAAALIFGWLHLNVRGMSEVVFLQAAWSCAVGAGFLSNPRSGWAAA